MGIRNFRDGLNHSGNINRIMEMHKGKCGIHQIVGVFKDEKIDITPEAVSGIISSHDALCAKALPKKAAKAAINAKKQPKDNLGDNESLVPA